MARKLGGKGLRGPHPKGLVVWVVSLVDGEDARVALEAALGGAIVEGPRQPHRRVHRRAKLVLVGGGWGVEGWGQGRLIGVDWVGMGCVGAWEN